MQGYTFQDAGPQERDVGSLTTLKMQAKNKKAKSKTTQAYPSRCRFSAKNPILTAV